MTIAVFQCSCESNRNDRYFAAMSRELYFEAHISEGKTNSRKTWYYYKQKKNKKRTTRTPAQIAPLAQMNVSKLSYALRDHCVF